MCSEDCKKCWCLNCMRHPDYYKPRKISDSIEIIVISQEDNDDRERD
jgi:hypothetical protein